MRYINLRFTYLLTYLLSTNYQLMYFGHIPCIRDVHGSSFVTHDPCPMAITSLHHTHKTIGGVWHSGTGQPCRLKLSFQT